MTEEQAPLRDFAGLFIKQIAENWEIYVNGKMVRKEIYTESDGGIQYYRNLKDVLVYLSPSIIRYGTNILSFRIIGEPTVIDTGIYRSGPFIIDNYETLQKRKSNTAALVLIFLYLFVGLYHLALFMNKSSERYNLLFGLFSVCLFLYLFCRTTAINEVFFNTRISLLIEYCSLYLLFPLLLFFFDYTLHGKPGVFAKVYGSLCLVLVAATLLTPHSFHVDLLRVWQYSAAIPLLYGLIFQLGRGFIGTANKIRNAGEAGEKIGTMRSLFLTLTKTVPGNLLIGAMVPLVCAVLDILDALDITSRGLVLTNYGFFIFIIGITLVLMNRFGQLYTTIDGLNLDLSRKSRDLKETRAQYGISQEKYRLLVEGSNDIIFSLDEECRFITANRAMHALIGMKEDELRGKTLIDVLHEGEARSVSTQFVQGKLVQFLSDREPLHLKLDFRTPFGIEPATMHVRLEYINIEGRNEIFGRGASLADDILNRYLEGEHQCYRIGNMLLVADDLSYRLTRNLGKFIDKRELNLLRVAIREMIINAIEHGNLAITFDEKTRELVADNYFEYLNERQKDPRFRERTVSVEYRVDPCQVEYTIVDEGDGFDFRKFINDDVDANDEMLTHGRGISLAKSVFDEIRYSEVGNSVLLVKRFNIGR
ncbi:MAG: ATP-binding protein [Spirochaetes bacterium]|nr:ATP-binding protein [Spirochaetota bacterium]